MENLDTKSDMQNHEHDMLKVVLMTQIRLD